MYIGYAKTYDFVCLYAVLSCLHTCMLSSDIKRINRRIFEIRSPIQTFEKRHNVSCRYLSYVKSETSDIWRTDTWFLKPFEESVEENHKYGLVKPNATVKTSTVCRG